MVGVDDPSFTALGSPRWPFTHALHAKLIDRLRRDGAKVIAMDIQFSEPSNTDDETFALLDAINRAGNVVESTTQVDQYGNGQAFRYDAPAKVDDSHKRRAVTNFLECEKLG